MLVQGGGVEPSACAPLPQVYFLVLVAWVAWRRHVDAALSTTWTWLRSTATFQHDSFEPLLATPCAGFRREYDGVHGGGEDTRPGHSEIRAV